MIRRSAPYLVVLAGFGLLALLRPSTPFTVIAVILLLTHFALIDSKPTRPAGIDTVGERRIAVIIPAYNEDEATLLKCVESVLAQDGVRRRIIVVNDGSKTFPALNGVEVITHPTNLGKRQAIASAVRAAPDAEIYVSLDSDTIMEPRALRALAAEIAGDVKAATGSVYASNRAKNLLTRAQDVIYSMAFLLARNAQSRFGAVIVCSGALAAYDGDMVRAHLDDFLAQRSPTGEDRRMTSYALREGKTRFARGAVAYTTVPETLSHWMRQQTRWARSWARESYLGLSEQRLGGMPWLVMASDIIVYVLFTAGLIGSVAFAADQLDQLAFGYLLVSIILGPVRSIRYLTERTDLTLRARLAGLGVMPLFGVMYTLIGMPVRMYGIATSARAVWGTRHRGVEVTA